MSTTTHAHYGLYGNISLLRGTCPDCKGTAFIIDNRFACCDLPAQIELPKKHQRISEPPDERKGPSAKFKKEQLEIQNFACFYCGRRFGLTVKIEEKLKMLKVHWDHMVPWSHNQNNTDSNFVAACHVCNSWKSNLMFNSLEDAQIFLLEKWKETEVDAEV